MARSRWIQSPKDKRRWCNPSEGTTLEQPKDLAEHSFPGTCPTLVIPSFRIVTHATILGVSCGRIACLPRTAFRRTPECMAEIMPYKAIPKEKQPREQEERKGKRKLTLLILFKAIFLQVRFRLCFWLIGGFAGLLSQKYPMYIIVYRSGLYRVCRGRVRRGSRS